MARSPEHLDALLALSPDERLEAANTLLDSLDAHVDPDWEAAWAEELARRLDGLRDGTRQAVDGETVRVRAAARLAAVRR